jgi:thiol-disulfide isomerase/thioredoxin
MIRLFITLALILCCSVKAEVISNGTWKITKHPPREQKYWPDEIFVFDDKGEKFHLDTIEDKTILVVFWATWCTHCLGEMISLDVLKKDFKKLPLEILAISQDYQGIDVVKKFYLDNEIRHLNILHDYKFKLFSALNVSSLPQAFLIDQNKKIVLSFDGPVKWHDDIVRKLLLGYIPGNPVEPNNTYKEEFFNTASRAKSKPKPTNKDENNDSK